MTQVRDWRPDDTRQACEMVAEAAAGGISLEIVGGGSKRGFGRPVAAERRLEVGGLVGVVDYDPAELVVTALAGTPLAEVEGLLAAHRQVLAFEPPCWGGLLGTGGGGTLGGTIACNLAGPRRVRAGAARDHLLGFSAINGWGDAWKSGGRVVKNVTGYDMGKLQAGAFGTLSVLTEVCLRVVPMAETSCSVVVEGLEDGAGVAAMAVALNSPHEISGAAHLPASVAVRGRVGVGAVTVLRLEGPAPSVAYRARTLVDVLGGGEVLAEAPSVALWRAVGEVEGLLGEAGMVVRVCTAPSLAPAVMAVLREGPAGEMVLGWFYDWGGGVLWVAMEGDGAVGMAAVRAAMGGAGGHATLVRAPEDVRGVVEVFEPEAAALEALSARVKAGFDPLHILNPGRMRAGR